MTMYVQWSYKRTVFHKDKIAKRKEGMQVHKVEKLNIKTIFLNNASLQRLIRMKRKTRQIASVVDNVLTIEVWL